MQLSVIFNIDTCLSTLTIIHLQEDVQETFGWKVVHGDVFRPPAKGMLLSAFLGSGVQLFFMTLITLCKIYIFYIPFL